MSLLVKWTNAAAGTNAAKARTIANTALTGPQTPDQLVNFFNTSNDLQTEFSGNKAGTFLNDAGGAPGRYAISRFLPKATNKGDALFVDTKFTNLITGDSAGRNGANRVIHKFNPEAKFESSATLSEFAKSKAK